MKNILYIVTALVLLFGGYFLFNKNLEPAPVARASDVVELKNGDSYDLTAGYVTKEVADKEQRMLAYNGMIPGPTIKVPQGAEITINFKNNTDLPALLHSHGVRMDNAFDGAQTSQKDIPPGGSFSYTLKFPDVGVFWYHPHTYEVYEQALGLYGAFVVTPSDPNYYPPVNQEVPLFLSDLPTSREGDILLKKDSKDYALMGHYGNTMLVNGEENYSLSVKRGEVVRLDVINAANVRPFNFAIAGTKLKIVGGDNGAYEKAFFADSITLAPSERAIVDVLFLTGGEYTIENKTPIGTYPLGSVLVSGDKATVSYAKEFTTLQANTSASASIDPFRTYFNKTPDKKLKLTVDISGGAMSSTGGHMMPDGTMMGGSMTSPSSDGIEWEDEMPMMGTLTTDAVTWKIVDQDTGKANADINWVFKKGVPVKIEIFNDPHSAHPMQHPIHFHGQRFLVVSRNGVPQTNLVWKDTALVKAGETVDIILDPSNLGEWMAHCHISEHLQGGMMFMFKVE
ncbi:MAG: multicopper oxidase family protein [Patescibacteria group bacterium]